MISIVSCIEVTTFEYMMCIVMDYKNVQVRGTQSWLHDIMCLFLPVNSVNYLGAHMVSHTPMDPHFLGSDLLLGKMFPANLCNKGAELAQEYNEGT